MGARLPLRLGAAVIIVATLMGATDPPEPAKPTSDIKPIAIAELSTPDSVDFSKHILPIFRSSCLACHNAKDAKGELVLETPAGIRKGGETGPAVVAGKGSESLLIKAASHQAKPFMPPARNKANAEPLTPDQLGLIKRWIDQGAKGEVSAQTDPTDWQPLPAALQAVEALAVSPDGQFAACGRANQVFIYHLPSRRLVTRLTDPALVTAGGKPGVAHRDLVQSLAFSPDGKLLASGGYRDVKLWRRPDSTVRFSFADPAVKAVTAVAASSDRKTVAVAGNDNVIRLYDVAGKLRAACTGHAAAVTALHFSLDGQTVFSASIDKSIRSWSAATGEPLARIGTPSALNAMTLLGDGTIVTGGADNFLRTWSAPQPAKLLADTAAPVKRMALSADRKREAVACADGKIRIIDAGSGKVMTTLEGDGARTLSFDAAGTHLLCSSGEGRVALWDIDAAKSVQSLAVTDAVLAAAIRPDGKQAICASADGDLSIFRLDGPADRAIANDDELAATVAAVSPDRRLLATAGTSHGANVVLIRDIASGKTLYSLTGHTAAITALAFNADASRLISGSQDHTARVFDLGSQKEIAKFGGQAETITAVAVRPGNVQAASAAADGSVKLWTIADSKEVRGCAGHTDIIVGLFFTPDGKQLVSASVDKSLNVFDPESGNKLRTIPLESPASALALSRDGAKVAAATQDKRIRIFTLADGSVVRTFTAPGISGFLSFDDDAKRLLGAAAPKQAAVWDLSDGAQTELFSCDTDVLFAAFSATPTEILLADKNKSIRAIPSRYLRSLKGHTKLVTQVLYSRDGTLAFAASQDGSIRGYSADDASLRFTANNGSPILDMALSPDGQWLATAGEDKLIHLWTAGGQPGPKPPFGPMTSASSIVSFSSDSKRVIAGGAAGEVSIFGVETGLMIESASPIAAPLAAIALPGSDPKLETLLLASGKSIYAWQPAAQRQWSAHAAPVAAVAASPTVPTQLMSGGQDGTVRQWDAVDARQMREFYLSGPLTCLGIQPGFKRFAAGGTTKFAKLWDQDGRDVAMVRGERFATEFAKLNERKVEYVNAEIGHWRNEISEVTQRQAAERLSVTRAMEARTAVEKDLATRKKTMEDRSAVKVTADKTLADASTALAAATAAKDSTAKAAAAAVMEAEQYKQTVAQARAAMQSSVAESNTRAQSAVSAKNAADASAADMTAKAKVADDKKAAAQKAPADAALAAAQAAAEKAATDSAAKSKDATAAMVAAQKSADEALAKSKAATEALATAEKMSADLDAKAQAAMQAKNAAAGALEQATSQNRGALERAKEADRELNRAEIGFMNGQINSTSAEKAVASAEAGVTKAARDLDEAKKAEQETQALLVKAQAELAAAAKGATEAEKAVTALAFSPDGSTLITGSEDGALHTWGAESGGALDTLPGHSAAVTSLALCPDGSILSGSADGTAKLWNVGDEWKLVKSIGNGTPESPIVGRVLAIAFGPDGKLLATGSGIPSRSGELKLWSIPEGTLAREFTDAHSDTVFGLSFSSDGKMLASCAADKFAKVFTVADGKLARSFEGHTNHVLGVGFRYDNRAIVTGGADNLVKFWDVTNGEQKPPIQPPFTGEITSLHYLGFTDTALVTTGNGEMRFVRAEGVTRNFDAGANFISASVPTPDGAFLLAGGQDGTLRMWDARDGQLLATFAPPVNK